MKNKSSRCPGSIRPMIYSIASALTLMGAASQAQAQFAQTPLYLQNESKIVEQPKVKHNIMFFIDDSGSMATLVRGAYDEYGRPLNRLDVTKIALKGILAEYKDQFNWGLQTLHNNGRSDVDFYSSDPKAMEARVNALKEGSATPATRRYFEIVSTIVMPKVEYRCQKSYVIMMSDGDANYSSYCGNYRNWPDRTIFDYEARRYYHSAGRYRWDIYTPYNTKEYQDAYKYFGERPMQDRPLRCVKVEPSYDQFWDRGNGLAFFSRKLATKDFKVGGTDKAGKSWDGDPNDFGDYKKQTVQTFTVGFGNDITPAGADYLRRGATRDPKTGLVGYYTATDRESLLAAFKNITDTIKNDSQDSVPKTPIGGTAPATSSSGIPDLAATIKLNTGSWSSQILFNKLNEKGRRSSTDTNTDTQPSFGNRKTLINTGSHTYFIDAIPADADKVNNAYFGIENSDKDEWKKLLNWTGRVGSNDNAYSPYRPRNPGERDLGDILDGSVAAVGNQEHGRRKYLVAAANDGMVHIFQSTAGEHPYDLKVSYLPSAMERENDASGNPITLAKVLKDIAHADYGKSIENHKYGVNGGFTLRQTPVAEQGSKFQQRVFMFGAMGQGGRGAYALNIGGKEDQTTNTGLDAAAWSDKVPLFETPKGDANKLGYTIGTPQIGRVSIKRETDGSAKLEENIRYAGFLASGYAAEEKDAATNETALYVYEMLGKEVGTGEKRGQSAGEEDKTGKELAKIIVPGGVGGLSTPTLLDTDFDGVVDFAFAGDRGGNMYRFDLRGETPKNWTAVKIFSGSSSKPITSAPAVSRKGAKEYVVIFGTGSEIYQSDLSNTETQSIYGIVQKLDKTPKDLFEDKANKDIVEQNLREQTITEREQSYKDENDQLKTGKALYLSNEKIEEAHKGWFINLRPGERVSIKPTMILRTAIVTIRKYTSDGGKTIGKEEAEKDLCMPVINNKSTVPSTTFLGINADNGGALNERSARFTPFIRDDGGFGKQYANGLTQEGIVSFTFIDPNKRTDDPVTADGDSGGTGTDKELGLGSGTPNNRCFSGKEGDQRSLLLNEGESLDVKGRICGLQRISWRELFF